MVFTLQTGTVRVSIKNESGVKIGEAIYNPKDFGIFQRAEKSQYLLDEVKKVFANYTAGEQNDKTAFKVMEDACSKLAIYCNTIFGQGFYDAAFSNVNPFTELESGEWFCVEVIRMVLDDIAKRLNRRKESESKYLGGYQPTDAAEESKDNV